MFKSATLFLVLVALWGMGDCRNIAEAEEDEASASAISTDVNELRYLHYTSLAAFDAIDFNNRATLEGAAIRADLPVVITIDGFLSNTTSLMTTLLRQTYLSHGGYNLIVLDWSKLSGSEANVGNPLYMAAAYTSVLKNVEPVGSRLAEFLELLEETKGIPLSRVILVGGSLGAHIAGAAGTALRKRHGASPIMEIVGLDPAGPFFSMQVSKDKRLHKGDAQFVAIYHSNRGTLGDSDHDTGDINVYINGGDKQPGCEQADKDNSGVCSHTYAFKTFNLAFNDNVKACPCVGNSECTCNDCVYTCDRPILLGPNTPTNVEGRYHASLSDIL